MDHLFQQALRDVLHLGRPVDPVVDNTSPHSRFGQGGDGTLEVRDWYAKVERPKEIELMNATRGATLFRALGMAAWNILGRRDVASMLPYNPAATLYSDNSLDIRAPWGARLFAGEAAGDGGPFRTACDLLSRDPSTLRAVVPVYAREDVGVASRDVPCLISLVLHRRGPALVVTAVFRSIGAYSVLPYDHALISVLAEIARAHVKADVFELSYFVASLQIRKPEIGAASQAIAEEAIASTYELDLPDSDLSQARVELARFEPALRAACMSGSSQLVLKVADEADSACATWAGKYIRDMASAWGRGPEGSV